MTMRKNCESHTANIVPDLNERTFFSTAVHNVFVSLWLLLFSFFLFRKKGLISLLLLINAFHNTSERQIDSKQKEKRCENWLRWMKWMEIWNETREFRRFSTNVHVFLLWFNFFSSIFANLMQKIHWFSRIFVPESTRNPGLNKRLSFFGIKAF